jgi:hypothetical protein
MDWRKIASQMGTRNQRQCRERWRNYLSPQVADPQEWTSDEESRLASLYSTIGSQWSLLASYFPGRSIVNITNRLKMLQRRERRLAAAQQQLASALRPIESPPEIFFTSENTIPAHEPNPSNPADPLGFLSNLEEPFESLFGESTTNCSPFNCFCQH